MKHNFGNEELSVLTGKSLTEEELQYLKSVVVVNCGGTINMAGVSERKPAGAVKNQIEHLRTEMQRIGIEIQFIDVFDRPPDSSNMGESEWEIMYATIAEIIQRKKRIETKRKEAGVVRVPIGGVVVTHGTDTLQISSFVLSLKLSMEDTLVPVVFTGSYAPIGDTEGSDASTNLRNSLLVARERFDNHVNSLPSGVYVLIGQDIHLASRISKVYSRPNSEGKYFISFPAPVGKVFFNKRGFQIKVNQQYLSRIKGVEPLKKGNVQETVGWGIVEHLVIDYFTSPVILEDFKQRVVELYQVMERRIGLIIQGDFSRNPEFAEFQKILLDLSDLGVVTLLGSHHAYQSMQKKGELSSVGKIHKSLTHGRARVKLSWLLKFNLNAEEIISLMNTNIVGEIFEAKELPHWIMYETLPDLLEGKEIIMIYPNIHHRVIDHAINRIQSSGEKGRLYLVGFGDGHIPAPNRSISQMTEDFLKQEGLAYGESFSTCENVAGLLHDATLILQKSDPETLKQYILQHYRIHQVHLRSALYREMATEQNQVVRQSLEENFANNLEEFLVKNADYCKLKNTHELLCLLKQKAKFSYTENFFRSQIEEAMIQYGSLLDFTIKRYPQLILRRLIKDALLPNHPLLNRIGKAIDQGILVEIKTSVARAKTNTDLYEIGNMLKIIGVHSDIVEGWNTLYLIRK